MSHWTLDKKRMNGSTSGKPAHSIVSQFHFGQKTNDDEFAGARSSFDRAG